MSYIINKMINDGEFIIINNTDQYNAQKNIKNITIQTALMIAGNDSFLGFELAKNKKILFINPTENSDIIFETMLKQLNGLHVNPEYENIKVLNIELSTLLNQAELDILTEKISESDFDVIVWNNINIIQEYVSNYFKKINSSESSLSHTIFIIKKISGMKTKIVSHLYNAIIEKEEFNKINDLASASLTLSRKDIIAGYQLHFVARHNDNKSVVKLERNEDKDNFMFKKILMTLNGITFKEEVFEEPQSPFSF